MTTPQRAVSCLVTLMGMERFSMLRPFSIAIGVFTVCLWIADPINAESSQKTLAIVSGEDVDAQALADLLGAELSRHDDIRLVERDRIRAVLSEWKLNASGLVARERQVELGRIIAADVVLLVEQAKMTQPPSLHVSSVETHTGLQLSSVFVRAKAVDELESVARDAVRGILEQSRIPDDKRLYVAVSGVHSEAPGQKLSPIVQALTSALVHDLRHTPRIFLLERKRLQQLTAERDLTGIELALRSSARLIEADLRGDAQGEGYRISISLLSSGGQVLKRNTLNIETTDFESTRQVLYRGAVNLLDGVKPQESSGDRTSEAQHFAALAQWLYSNGRYEEAVDAAETAFALDATRKHSWFLYRAHDALLRLAMQNHNMNRVRELSERRKARQAALYDALVSAMRCHELDMFNLQQPKEAPSEFPIPTLVRNYSVGDNAFNPHVPRLYAEPPNGEPSLEPEPQPMQELRQAYDALRLQKYRMLVEREKANPRLTTELAFDALTVVDYFAADGRDYVRLVLAIQKQIDRQVAALESQGGGGPVRFDGRQLREVDMMRRKNADKLAEQLGWVHEKGVGHSTPLYHPQWQIDDLIPLWSALMKHDEPKISVLGCLELTSVDKYRDAAVRRGLEVLPEVDRDGVELCAQIRKHLGRTDELEPILEGVIARAEKANAPAELTHRKPLILALFGAIGADRGDWRARIDTLLSDAIEAKRPESRDAINLRELLDRQAWRNRPAPNTPLGFELSGAWAEYQVRIVEPDHPDWNRGLWPNISSSNSPETNDPWVYFFDSDEQLLIGKIHLVDGKVDTIARTPWVKGGQAWARPVTATSDADALYIMTGRPGIARVDLKTKQVGEWGVADGFVGEKITSMAIHRSKVYMGMDGGLSEFDPATQKFRLLASSSAVEQRSPLDDRDNRYMINQIVSDPRADCLWIHVVGGSRHKLNGIWRYSPAKETFEKCVDTSKPAHYATSNVSWFHNDLFFLSTHGWQVLDTQTGVAAVLGGYADYGFSTPTNPVFLRVGDHIVQRCGRVYTPDRKVHDLGLPNFWLNLLPTRQGFVAHRPLNQKTQLLVFTRNDTTPNK